MVFDADDVLGGWFGSGSDAGTFGGGALGV